MVWSTFDFDLVTKKAHAWMSQNLVDSMVKREWVVSMFRTDLRHAAFQEEAELCGVVVKRERWGDQIEISGNTSD